MEIIENYIKKLDVFNFVVIILLTIVLTLISANYFKFCTFKPVTSENLMSVSVRQQTCDCGDGRTNVHGKLNSYMGHNNSNSIQPIKNNLESPRITPNKSTDNKMTLSFYYMNGCGFCKVFTPEWEKVKSAVSNSNLKNMIQLEDTDCQQNNTKCTADHEYIKGYPTVILKKLDGSRVLYNDYPRTYESVMKFIQSNIN